MAANRNTKPARSGRMALVLGWMQQSGDAAALIGRCGRCGQDATTYTLAGIGGRPARYIVLAHADADTNDTYSFDSVFACCNFCNAADGTAAVTLGAIQPFARGYFLTDTRASASEVKAALLTEAEAAARGCEAESASTRLPL